MTAFRESSISFEDLRIGACFLWRLPALLRHPLKPAEARTILRQRLEQREADFLGLVRQAIYQNPGSPYRQLLHLAGCEYGDLERLVTQAGVEGALHNLHRQGVYLSVDEFKGKRPVVRGNTTLTGDPTQLWNPLSASHIPSRSSGSRSGGTPVLTDLSFVWDCAVNTSLAIDVCGGTAWPKAHWQVPGGVVIARLLEFCISGAPPVHWFSQVNPAASGLHFRYRWSGCVMRWGGLLSGVPLPRPEYVPLDDPLPVARWIAKALRGGQTPLLHTFPSSALRLCEAAFGAGIDLRGAHFRLGGEPITETRLSAISRGSGAERVMGLAWRDADFLRVERRAPHTTSSGKILHLHLDRRALPSAVSTRPA